MVNQSISGGSAGQSRKRKPKAPPAGKFPLFQHATGRWAKKVRQRLHYFGKISEDPDGQKALALWLEQRDDLLSGRKPRPKGDGLTVADLANRFLTFKTRALEAGEITARTVQDYHTVAALVVGQFGRTRAVSDLDASDFEALRAKLALNRGPITLGWTITKVRSIFNYGYEQGLLDRPIRYGQGFSKPSVRLRRKARAERGPMLYDAAMIRAMLERASVPLRAMILLGINAGYGNSDCAKMPKRSIDWEGGWLNYPRPKTGIDRRAKAWPETLAALKAAINARPAPKAVDHDALVFVTSKGGSWAKDIADNPIAKEFRKLTGDLGCHRPGLGFYSLRRTFATVASGCRDQVAVDHVMGHAPGASDMSAVYRQGIDDERLERVADYVRNWLFGKPATSKRGRKGGAR